MQDRAEAVLKPLFPPKDGVDVLVGLSTGLLTGLLMPAVPSLAIYLLTGSVVISAVAFPAIFVVWLLFMVRGLVVSQHGLRFVRVFGWPRDLCWSEIESIEKAPRREVVLYGWLWPPFPAREMTPSMTALGHYRIRTTDGRWAYFPPADPEKLESLVKHYGSMASNPPLNLTGAKNAPAG